MRIAGAVDSMLKPPVCLGLSVGSFFVIPQLMIILYYWRFFSFSSSDLPPAPKADGAVCVVIAVAVLAVCGAGYVRQRRNGASSGPALAAMIVSAAAVVLAVAVFVGAYLGPLGGALN